MRKFSIESRCLTADCGADCLRWRTDYFLGNCCGGSLGRRRLTREGGRRIGTRLGVAGFKHSIRWLLAGEEIDRLSCNSDHARGQGQCVL
jgi:hypothetical protein